MVESKEKSQWEFKQVCAKDYLNKLTGSAKQIMISQAKLAGQSAGVSWKDVQLMPYATFLKFLSSFVESQGVPAEYHFLGNG